MGVNYHIRLFNDAEDIDQTVEAQGDRYILEVAEAAGMDLPYLSPGVCPLRPCPLQEHFISVTHHSSS